MLHTYIPPQDTNDAVPIVIVGLTHNDLTEALQRGETGHIINPSKSCPVRIAIIVGKSDEDMIHTMESYLPSNTTLVARDVREDR